MVEVAAILRHRRLVHGHFKQAGLTLHLDQNPERVRLLGQVHAPGGDPKDRQSHRKKGKTPLKPGISAYDIRQGCF